MNDNLSTDSNAQNGELSELKISERKKSTIYSSDADDIKDDQKQRWLLVKNKF